jgi:hypothetical protein
MNSMDSISSAIGVFANPVSFGWADYQVSRLSDSAIQYLGVRLIDAHEFLNRTKEFYDV